MGTSPAESFNAAGNIFIGQTEAPLLIRPFLDGMTESELHAVMTGGFATIAGSVLATYIHFGVSAHHLVSGKCISYMFLRGGFTIHLLETFPFEISVFCKN